MFSLHALSCATKIKGLRRIATSSSSGQLFLMQTPQHRVSQAGGGGRGRNSKRRRTTGARVGQSMPIPTLASRIEVDLDVSMDTTPSASPYMTPRSTSPNAPGAESSRGFTNVRFNDFLVRGLISKPTSDGIASLRPIHEFCTEVQAQTLPVILTGVDTLAQAKTGTGKTLGFLVPAIELLVRSRVRPGQGIAVLILSPTRELAIQTEEAAKKLLSATSFSSMSVVGGTNMSSETRRINQSCPEILVATPGRLEDHLVNSGLADKLKGVKCLILDEADRLLEQGFRQTVTKIIKFLPNRQQSPRQTLLFSATLADEVHQIAKLALLPDFKFISTISEADTNTHEHVPQYHLSAEFNQIFPMTLATVRDEMRTLGGVAKIMLFFPTARATAMAFNLFAKCNLGIPSFEIHSRKSQPARNAAADSFKQAASALLFSSDVTARGMDFPDVTTVLQVGLPMSHEQYIHRLGRTARAGASGSGIIILSPWENFFLKKPAIRSLPLGPHPAAKTELALDSPAFRKATEDVTKGLRMVDGSIKSQSYAASLGFYKAYLKDCFHNDANEMVRVFNDYAKSSTGLAYEGNEGPVPGLPPIQKSTIGKMGIKGVQGLNVVATMDRFSNGSNIQSTGRGGRGGGGGASHGSLAGGDRNGSAPSKGRGRP